MDNDKGDTPVTPVAFDGAALPEPSEVFDLDTPAPDGAEASEESAETEQKTEAKGEEPKAEDQKKDDAKDEDKPPEDEEAPKRLKGAAKWRERARQAEARIAELESRQPEKGDGETKRDAPKSDDIDAEVENLIGKPPKESDFTDWAQFQRALNRWDMRAINAEDKIRAQKAERQVQSQEDAKEILEAFEARAEAFAKQVPDFREALDASDVTIARHVGELIVTSEKSHLIQYHLAKNPDRAKALNNMSHIAAAKEIGRLEDRLTLPKPKTETKASPPETPLTGGAKPSSDDVELAAWMKKTYG
jgi:hypothetical protein